MYESFYGLKEKPFTLLPDPEYLYLSPKHQRALTLLEYGMMNKAGFSVICGDTGAGKTTLIRRLLLELGDDTSVGLITNTHQSFGELLNWVLMAFGLDGEGKSKAQMHQIFINYLIDQYSQNKHSVLIVDEAQNMNADTLEELRMLSNINADKDQVLQVILAGQPALRETLRRPELMQFAQRISVDYYLEALSMEETRAYIKHRLEVAGSDKSIFTDEASDAIFKYSGGTPRLINLLCDTTLVYGFAEQNGIIQESLVHDVVREQHSNSIIPTFNTTQPHATDNMPLVEPLAVKAQQTEEKQEDGIANLAQRAVKAVASAEQVVSTVHSRTAPTTTTSTLQVERAGTGSQVKRDETENRRPVEGEQASKKPENVTENARITPINARQAVEPSPIAVENPASTAVEFEKESRGPEPQDKHRAEPPVENEAEAEIDLNSIRIEPESTQVVSSSFAAFDEARKTRAEEAYPIVHIEENPKKGTSMVLVGIVAGMFIASLAMMVMSWVMFGAKEPSAPVSASGVPIDFEAHREEDLRELQAIERERDTALAVGRALKLERDAAVNAAAAREKIRKAELRAAEILAEQAEQERKIEKRLMAAKIRAQEAEQAEARALDRERELRIKAQKKSKEIEARQARREKERAQARAVQAREARRLEQERKAAKAASDARIARAREQQMAQEAIARQVAEEKAKAAQAESKRFSSNPCNSPSAKFLSTCKK